MSNPSARRIRRSAQRIPNVEWAIFVVGLIAAAASGVAAYHVVGPYGDGPLNMNLYRDVDPETGRSLLVRKGRTSNGQVRWYRYDEQTRQLKDERFTVNLNGVTESVAVNYTNGWISGFERDVDGDGRPDIRDYYDAQSRLAKVGFSLAGNGVIDAWEYRNSANELQKIEISRRQDDVIDRTEHYKDGQLARAEEDNNRDGRIDRWLTYDAGILIEEADDRNGDGKPDDHQGAP